MVMCVYGQKKGPWAGEKEEEEEAVEGRREAHNTKFDFSRYAACLHVLLLLLLAIYRWMENELDVRTREGPGGSLFCCNAI